MDLVNFFFSIILNKRNKGKISVPYLYLYLFFMLDFNLPMKVILKDILYESHYKK